MKSFALVLVLLCGVAACDRRQPSVQQGPVADNSGEQATLDEFKAKIAQYYELHKEAEAKLPKMPTEATPEQIDKNQRELGRLLTAARPTAKQGELFTPAMETLLRKHLARIFNNPTDGAAVKGSVMDENPTGVTLAVNARYPDNVPISTMPPDLLQLLPKMPEDFEYRFVGRHLVILDVHAHLIADFVTNAIPQ